MRDSPGNAMSTSAPTASSASQASDPVQGPVNPEQAATGGLDPLRPPGLAAQVAALQDLLLAAEGRELEAREQARAAAAQLQRAQEAFRRERLARLASEAASYVGARSGAAAAREGMERRPEGGGNAVALVTPVPLVAQEGLDVHRGEAAVGRQGQARVVASFQRELAARLAAQAAARVAVREAAREVVTA